MFRLVSLARRPVSFAHRPVSFAHRPVSFAHRPVSFAHRPVSLAHRPVSPTHHPVTRSLRWLSTTSDAEARPIATSLSLIQDHAVDIRHSLVPVEQYLSSDIVAEQCAQFEKEMDDPDFWDNPDRAAQVAQEHAQLRAKFDLLTELQDETQSTLDLATLTYSDPDTSEMEKQMLLDEFVDTVQSLDRKAKRFEIETVFDHPSDRSNCFVEISAGAGGKEAHEFAQMLMKMYMRWAERSSHECELSDVSYGEVGIKTAVVRIAGENMYGWMKNEQGVHRMVRISKYDTSARRHTAFAQVLVLPEMDSVANKEVEIDPKDLRIDTYRASGPGGQHVNKTDSAVRITHIPTGFVGQSQNDRSQHKNKSTALAIVKSKILDMRLKEQAKLESSLRANVGDNTWGNQIRSYVFNPYQMVKDHRTGCEVQQISNMMDGDPEIIGQFMEAQLLSVLKERNEGKTGAR